MTAGGALYGLPIPRIATGRAGEHRAGGSRARAFEVGADGYASRSQNSCFHGRTLCGRVELTLAAGAVAFADRRRAGSARRTR